jgi:fermentation-respiration switch protein FrsA (DUF1100 family)
MRLRTFLVALLFVVLAGGLAAAFLTGALQRGWDSARLIASLSGQAPTPAGWVVREDAFWTDPDAPGTAERHGTLYRSVHRDEAAAMVLVPGADVAGQAHPLFVAFAESLAAAGFLVLVPDLETLRRLQLSAADARRIAGAVAHMAGRPEGRDGVALAAISYAAGPAVLAALRPEVAQRVAAILGIGGYYDARTAAVFLTTGAYPDPAGEGWRVSDVPNLGRWVFLRANAHLLRDPDDRDLLAAIAQARRARADAPVGHLVDLLSPEGRAVWAVLDNRDPGRAGGLLDALPDRIRAELAALSPAERDLSRLNAELILVHGRDDPIVPFTESLALAEAAPDAELYLLDSLAHVELDLATLGDGWTLFRAAWHLLRVRDRLEAPSVPPAERR